MRDDNPYSFKHAANPHRTSNNCQSCFGVPHMSQQSPVVFAHSKTLEHLSGLCNCMGQNNHGGLGPPQEHDRLTFPLGRTGRTGTAAGRVCIIGWECQPDRISRIRQTSFPRRGHLRLPAASIGSRFMVSKLSSAKCKNEIRVCASS